ncbi:tRNA pseudouridine synthase A-like isoform X2 [Bradysia coprophila]|uniref:tRNA pseudouridine synthase A-like isoform X2 n=1 Tax=Bradysia coprophila TaxID=38358 RepID=UPI00187DB03A|nr:tRNA pseudouridine synthase A-like isoform X2 [Bradysia coprophila]
MFKLKELISKTNVLKIPAVQYFPIAFKKRFKNTDPSLDETKNFKRKLQETDSNVTKHCLMMGYSGCKYRGMQYQSQDGAPTIEEVLFKAMLECKWITYDQYKKPHSIGFYHGSRTDKGVSALRQCCSILLPTGLNIEDINQKLPDDVRVFGLKEVPLKFHARYFCRARTYAYTLPTIAFSHYNDQSSQVKYRVSADKLKFIDELLQLFKGNKNYHNFTVDKTYSDRSSYRQILDAVCEAPFLVHDVEFCTIRLKGRSFMMHQIRKMLGLMLAVAREVTDRSIFDMVFTDRAINCPTAPGLGLVLDRLHFNSFDQKHDSQYGTLSWEECEENVQQFFENQIKSKIVGTEIQEEQMMQWLETILNYLYIPEENNDEFAQSHKAYI